MNAPDFPRPLDGASLGLVVDLVRGATFDDFLLAPHHSIVERRDPAAIDLSSRLTRRITLKRPIVSANMDTVTRAPMAIVQAEEGGIGIIDRGFRPGDIQPQVREVEIVKRTQHVIIRDPYSIGADAPLADATAVMQRSRVGTLVVTDANGRLAGLLTERDIRFVPAGDLRVRRRQARVIDEVHRQSP
jgi:IMP dehydrogenase